MNDRLFRPVMATVLMDGDIHRWLERCAGIEHGEQFDLSHQINRHLRIMMEDRHENIEAVESETEKLQKMTLQAVTEALTILRKEYLKEPAAQKQLTETVKKSLAKALPALANRISPYPLEGSE